MIKLVRFSYSPMGTFGKLYAPDFTCWTVERPWAGNEPNVSCIPPEPLEGNSCIYPLKTTHFHRGGYDTMEVADVPGRSKILIHRGNVSGNVEGCIAVGMKLGAYGGAWAVLDSKTALDRLWPLYQALAEQDKKIEILNAMAGAL